MTRKNNNNLNKITLADQGGSFDLLHCLCNAECQGTV